MPPFGFGSPMTVLRCHGAATGACGVWRVACGVLCVVCCCVVCFTWFFQWSEQVSSVTCGRWHEANGRTGQAGASLLGSAVHGAQCFGCFEGHDKFQLATPLSHKRVGAAGRLRNRCLPRQLFEKAQSCAGALSSTLRACAWPFLLCLPEGAFSASQSICCRALSVDGAHVNCPALEASRSRHHDVHAGFFHCSVLNFLV